MGIDAEILIRGVPHQTVTDEWLKQMSWRLVRAVGANHFWISDGLRPEEYTKAYGGWSTAFESHALHAEWLHATGERRRELHEAIFAAIDKPPERLRTAIRRTLELYREEEDAAPGSEYHQDGDPILADGDECLLELSLSGRYYGKGYERGDILSYCAIAEWLEINIPNCVVYYGGDSSGVLAEPFGERQRKALRHHLYSEQGRDYFNYGGWGGNGCPSPPACGLCPGGKYRGQQYGTGPSYGAFACGGCGKSVETRDGGKTWSPTKER